MVTVESVSSPRTHYHHPYPLTLPIFLFAVRWPRDNGGDFVFARNFQCPFWWLLFYIENCWGDLDTLKGAIVRSAVLLFSMWGERGGGGGGGSR